ncbi:MAG: hypothetical protein H0X42_13025, partial [Solirubrobacterales bacterium]|nr:hypothetical protein [Solirubrobacterales bacterium]
MSFSIGGSVEAKVTKQGAADGTLVLTVANLGDAGAGGKTTPVKIADALPPGLKAVTIEGVAGRLGEDGPVKCELASLTCSFEGPLPAYDEIEVLVGVLVKGSAHSGEENKVSVSGGGAPAAQISRPITISDQPPPYGVQDFELTPEEEGGGPSLQAGSHPFQLTTTFTLNQTADAQPAALAKDINFHWPAGLLGNPTPQQRCSLGQFLAFTGQETINQCSSRTVVGVALISITEPFLSPKGVYTFTVPVFNIEPGFGEPARFGFVLPGTSILITPSIRSRNGEDYGITVSSLNTSQTAAFLSAQVTVWGTPGDPRHDSARGEGCIRDARGEDKFPCPTTEEKHPPAFLTLPTKCSGSPLQTSVQANSWADPGAFVPPFAASPAMPVLIGCNQVPFKPTIAAEPTSNAATSPTGLNFDLNVEDEGLTNRGGLAQSQIKKAIVTLPEGFTANPSVAEGLKACSLQQFESETVNSDPGTGCPEESKIGDVEIESPLVSQKIDGSLYVAKQNDNGFPAPSLLALYIVAKSPELGVLIKSAGRVAPDPTTGQLTTTFDDLPQLPFSHFHLSFRQGQRAPLVTPPACGTYTVQADLYPYSNPTVPLHDESSFQITQGPEGNGCPSGGVPPFHPGLEAGTINNAAGTYSPFYTHITRKDSEQEITRFSIKLPPGVIGKLAGVSSCSDAGIAAAKAREIEGGGTIEEAHPSCPANSEVGHSLVGSGVGNVLAYAPGKLYLAGPYHGSQLSLVSITAAKVGPFDLGTVVVRFALKIDPETAEVSVDGAQSDPIPHIVDGIPIHLRDIRAYVDRKDFT